MYKNGKQIQTKTALYAKSVTSQTDTFIMGAYRGSSSFNGNIAELMVFKDGHDLQPAKRARLITYLSLKYGISLDNSGGNLELSLSSVLTHPRDGATRFFFGKKLQPRRDLRESCFDL